MHVSVSQTGLYRYLPLSDHKLSEGMVHCVASSIMHTLWLPIFGWYLNEC